ADENFVGALPWYVDAFDADKDDKTADLTHRTRIASVLQSAPHLAHCWFNDQKIFYAEFSPDGRLIVFSDELGRVRLIDAASGAPVMGFQASTNAVKVVVFSPNGERLATMAYPDGARIWSTNGTEICHIEADKGMTSLRFAPNSTQLGIAGDEGMLEVWDSTPPAGHLVKKFLGHKKVVKSVAF